jgi:hypothetical protein
MKGKMSHLDKFLENRMLSAPKSVPSIQKIAKEFITSPEHLSAYDFRQPYSTILVGQVQSGKTGHYLGIAAAVADQEPRFPIFLLLTQNSVSLQQQTLKESIKLLTSFDVFDESSQVEFELSLSTSSSPKMVVLKKNKTPLRKWLRILNQDLLSGRPLFIIDDEADSTGLNTRVNVPDQSEINEILEELINTSTAYFLQVTATPQAIFLQNKVSVFRPKSHLQFKPGTGYLGGNFFFPESTMPYSYKQTDNNELNLLRNPLSNDLPVGLKKAIFTFCITAFYKLKIDNDTGCNFLIHPSVRQIDHQLILTKIQLFLKEFLQNPSDPQYSPLFEESYQDLLSTKPQIGPKDVFLRGLLNFPIQVHVLNSGAGNQTRELPRNGANIFIGGNVLSRGLVIPSLQTIYYCRESRQLLIDTFWQHSRAFGYDRDETMVRLFMPAGMYSNFVQMNRSIMRLFEVLETNHSFDVPIIVPAGMLPTRRAVVEDMAGNCIVGGVNHFPVVPNEENESELDSLLANYDENQDFYVIDRDVAIDILIASDMEEIGGIPREYFEIGIEKLAKDDKVVLAVRRNRSISAGTGTLLSPNDRQLSMSHPSDVVLILYKLNGEVNKGWNGNPFWTPNIKMPDQQIIYFK